MDEERESERERKNRSVRREEREKRTMLRNRVSWSERERVRVTWARERQGYTRSVGAGALSNFAFSFFLRLLPTLYPFLYAFVCLPFTCTGR